MHIRSKDPIDPEACLFFWPLQFHTLQKVCTAFWGTLLHWTSRWINVSSLLKSWHFYKQHGWYVPLFPHDFGHLVSTYGVIEYPSGGERIHNSPRKKKRHGYSVGLAENECSRWTKAEYAATVWHAQCEGVQPSMAASRILQRPCRQSLCLCKYMCMCISPYVPTTHTCTLTLCI